MVSISVATPQGFLPQHSLNWITQISDAVTTYTEQQIKHTARIILLIWENITISCHRSPARQILESLSKQHHQFTEHTAGTWPTQGTQSHGLGRVRVYGILPSSTLAMRRVYTAGAHQRGSASYLSSRPRKINKVIHMQGRNCGCGILQISGVVHDVLSRNINFLGSSPILRQIGPAYLCWLG